MSYFDRPEYVPVAEQRRRAGKELAKLKKRRRAVAPVIVEGREIAKNFWGRSWCSNLERYSDFASRLPRGRSYVRNGFVVDLQMTKGRIAAKVSGSELYDVAITIAPVAAKRWRAICRDCSGTIDSLVELLQGRLATSVMDRVCREGDGLFPAPDEVKLSCTCPDWADMCKHVAATLYGVGARLDEAPRLLFVLRGVDESELLAGSGQDLVTSKPAPVTARVLGDDDVAALFGLEMAEIGNGDVFDSSAPKQSDWTVSKDEASARSNVQPVTKSVSPRRKRSVRQIESLAGKKRARTESPRRS